MASVRMFNEAKDIEAHLTQKMHLHFLTKVIAVFLLRNLNKRPSSFHHKQGFCWIRFA